MEEDTDMESDKVMLQPGPIASKHGKFPPTETYPNRAKTVLGTIKLGLKINNFGEQRNVG